MFRRGFYVGLAFVLGLWLLWLWQPERQVARHTDNLFRAIERRNWSATAGFIDGEYLDQWGDDRNLLLSRMRQVLQYARTIRIEYAEPSVAVAKPRAVWQAKVTIAGSDDEITAYVKQRINSLTAPFELEWRRASGKPWDWKLVAVRNPDLALPTEFE
jgi:hypothetical protein